MTRARWLGTVSALISGLTTAPAWAQGNFEIQGYGSEQSTAGQTTVELHTNTAIKGTTRTEDGVVRTQGAVHETLEITYGFTEWFETAFYLFTSIQPDSGWQWVGDHIRPRVRIPEKWHWPVGVSLSQEFGYQRAAFSPDTWTWEIRPIIDKKIGRWYFSFNPALDRSFHGPGVNQGVTFSPNAKVGFDFTKKISGGMEYYAAYGPITGFDALRDQQQQVFPSIDVDLGPQWEFNFGVGVGATRSTDHLIVKCIVGRRFSWPHRTQTARLKLQSP